MGRMHICLYRNIINPQLSAHKQEISSRLKFFLINTPIQIATGIATQAGNTDDGKITMSVAMIVPNTALTKTSSRKMIIMKSALARLPIKLSDRAPIDFAPCRLLAHNAPMSCTPAKKIEPKVTHNRAGTHPQ